MKNRLLIMGILAFVLALGMMVAGCDSITGGNNGGTTGGEDNSTTGGNGDDNGTTSGNDNGTDNNSGNDNGNGTTGGNNSGNDNGNGTTGGNNGTTGGNNNGTTGGNGNGSGNGNEFVASTNETISNDVTTLGLTGTSVASSKPNVATAEITISAKIKITSVSEGSAVITVSDASSHSATINISVAKTGSITIGTIAKYTASNGENSQLPEPVGADELSGKEYDSGLWIISFEADNAYTITRKGWDDDPDELKIFNTGFYSWDTPQNTVILALDKSLGNNTLLNKAELKEVYLEFYSEDEETLESLPPGITLEQYIDMWLEKDFSLAAYTYEIEDGAITYFGIKVTVPDDGETIAGCAYTQKVVTEVFDVHYLLSIDFDEALSILTTAYGQPEDDWYYKSESNLMTGENWVVLEFTTFNDMRLTKRESGGGEPTTKGWILP